VQRASSRNAAAGTVGQGQQQQQQRSAAAGQAVAASGQQKDWRLQAPARKELPDFKPGAVTWDTDDYTSAAAAKQLKKQQQQKDAVAGGAAGAAAIAARPNPKAWYDQHHAKYEQSVHTTGATARAFTSTVAVAATKSERQLRRVDR